MNKNHQIILEYLAGNTSYGKLSKKYGLGRTTIFTWVKNYLASGEIPESKERVYPLPAIKEPSIEDMPRDVLILQRQLAEEQLRNKLLNAMIEIAETELKVPIKKKFGTKQSKK